MPMPTKYRPEMCALAFKVCLLGATDKQLADILEVHETNLNEWKAKHPEFAEALKKGKTIADAEVAHSLYRRATGYKHIAFKFFQSEGRVITKRYVHHYAPDTMAGMYWLNNRMRLNWRTRQDHEHSGPNGGPIEVTDTLEAGRRVAFALTRAAIEKANRSSKGAAKPAAKEKA